MRSGRLRKLRRARNHAADYAEWRQISAGLDDADGSADWRRDDESRHYDAAVLRRSLHELTSTIDANEHPLEVADHLHVSLHRHLAEVTAPELYTRSRVGTKHLVERYLDAVERALEYLRTVALPGVSHERRTELFRREAKNVGRSALLLSGGASLGLFHIGVIKALWETGLLPRVVSGASTGSMIAGGLCTRTEAELREVLVDPGERIYTRVFRMLGPSAMVSESALMATAQLARAIAANMHDSTFGEAHERTGRTLCMSVSPTRARQKPRLLCHVTAPDVLVRSASLASCAIPGLFPPATLQQRRGDVVSDYVAGERWIDGSVATDLPTARLARLLNVNHTIVSQTNAHVLPFTRARTRPGRVRMLTDLVSSSAYAQGLQVLSVARRHVQSPRARSVLEQVHGIADQRSIGDITIAPRITAWNYGIVLRNASPDDLRRLVAQGERSTWPNLHVIDAQTRVSRTLAACIEQLDRSQLG